MIAHLEGRLLRKSPQEVVVDVRGVGYRVSIPVSTFYRLGEEGSDVRLLIHTHVREDALVLFGFESSREQALFERLIAVSGIGPRLALTILSGIEPPQLIDALRSGDLARLTRIPGVGRKTAERLVLELKDKLADIAPPVSQTALPTPPASPVEDDLLSALANLGYSRPEAEKAVDRAIREDGGAGRFEDLLRRALQILSGR
jgi:holliday junction DNA helicase RuvA